MMKKTIATTVAILLLLGMFSGCGPSTGNPSNSVLQSGTTQILGQNTTGSPTTGVSAPNLSNSEATQPAIQPTTKPAAGVPTTALPNSTRPTTKPTTKPAGVGVTDPCANGHVYEGGPYCVYCATPNADYDPCVNGHTYQNGYCIYCLDPDREYTPNPTTKPITPTTGPVTPPTMSSTVDPGQEKVLKVMIPGHNPNNSDAWQNKVIAAFMSRYPGVTVQLVEAHWGDWNEKLLQAYEDGDPIDLVYISVNDSLLLYNQGLLQSVEPYVDHDNSSLQLDTMNACFRYGGAYYAAAATSDFGVIYYNKEILAQHGLEDPLALYERGEWTMAAFIRYANALTDKEKEKWGYASEYPYLFHGSVGTSAVKINADGSYALNVDDPMFVASLELIQDGWFNSGWQGWTGSALASFQAGESAMLGTFTMYESELGTLHILFPELYPDFEYGAVPVPGIFNNTGKNMVFASGWAIGNGADCAEYAGKLIDMLVDAQAEVEREEMEDIPAAHAKLYKQMRDNQICVNVTDSIIGGTYDMIWDITLGSSVQMAIEKYTPEYRVKIKEANSLLEKRKS